MQTLGVTEGPMNGLELKPFCRRSGVSWIGVRSFAYICSTRRWSGTGGLPSEPTPASPTRLTWL